MGHPWPLLHLFSSFQTHSNLFTNKYEKMSIQYTEPGFKLMTFWTWVSSHNHYSRAPALVTSILSHLKWSQIPIEGLADSENLCAYDDGIWNSEQMVRSKLLKHLVEFGRISCSIFVVAIDRAHYLHTMQASKQESSYTISDSGLCGLLAMWPDLATNWTLGKFLKPLTTIILPKSPTFLGNFC